MATETNLEKLQRLLRQMFQFDCSDLDFGIYRIMNHKRDAVERFIQKDLVEAIGKELSSGVLAGQSQVAAELQEVAGQIRETLGEDALNGDGKLAEAYHNARLGKRYLALQAKAVGAQARPALEAAIFNHLYTFFSRYYDSGDFLSKRRYSRKEKYAIPYNGEEVYLHWANSDQYYIKTGEYFTDYRFTSRGLTVHFRLQQADVEQNNVKGDKRFFVPLPKEAVFDAKAKEIVIFFEYRPLTEQETVKYGQRNQQDAILAEAQEAVLKHLGKADVALAALMAVHHQTAEGQQVSCLEHHLRQYTQRNTSDFFVHKDLKNFLLRELDFYLKNEVLNLDDVAAGEARAEGWFQVMRVIRAIGEKVIVFLAQVEDFQKRLFEKRKFVVETNYCITVSQIAEVFHAEIAANDAQWQEWKDLFRIDEEERNLFNSGAKNRKDRRIAFLKVHPTLVLDTKHFEQDFRDRLLASFGNLDAITDGLLINSENFQALAFLLERFREGVDCVYIDPPYNTGDSEILYKNDYLFSSWLSLMENRLAVSQRLLAEDPVQFIAIDDFEMADLCALIDKRFPLVRREMIVVNHHPQGGQAKTLANTHEYMLACVSRASDRTLSGRTSTDGVEERPFKRSGTAESNFRYARPNSFYAILVDPKSMDVVGLEPPPGVDGEYPTEKTSKGLLRVYPLGSQRPGSQREERVWRRSYESCLALVAAKKLKCTESMTIYQLIEAHDRTTALFSNWIGPRYNAGTNGANLLADIIGRHNPFAFPKSIHTVEDAIFSAGIEGRLGLPGLLCWLWNYRACRHQSQPRGWGEPQIHPGGDGRVLRHRSAASPQEGNLLAGMEGRQARCDRPQRRRLSAARASSSTSASRVYEDSLNNISFTLPKGQKVLEFDDYLLKYMLDWETKESETLLNVEKLASPFSYGLHDHRRPGDRPQDCGHPGDVRLLAGPAREDPARVSGQGPPLPGLPRPD